jgi:hypothetical protein
VNSNARAPAEVECQSELTHDLGCVLRGLSTLVSRAHSGSTVRVTAAAAHPTSAPMRNVFFGWKADIRESRANGRSWPVADSLLAGWPRPKSVIQAHLTNVRYRAKAEASYGGRLAN